MTIDLVQDGINWPPISIKLPSDITKFEYFEKTLQATS